jgi:lactoylglutathione lyase
MRVPDGEDYIEFMLYDKYPPLDRVHSMQHICLEVASVVEAQSILSRRVLPPGTTTLGPVRVGVNGKRQLNAFDPDGTRVELMEPVTADGQPRASSTAPPPVGEPRPGSTPRQ